MLSENVFLVFPVKSILTMHGISITRLQISIMPGFAIMDYKVQRAIFRLAVLDLHRNSKSEDKGLHKRFYFIYVQLSYLQTLNKVQLLQPIMLNDIRSKLYSKFQKKA